MTIPPGPKARGFGTPDNIDDLFLAKLTSSGLDLTDAKQLGYLALDREETFRLKLPVWSPYRIPSFSLSYFDPLEKANWNFTRYRYLLMPVPEPKTKDGKEFPKYIQPKNSPLHVYFPTIKVSWKKVFNDVDQAIIITEGELKAACATKFGFPTIGLGGVDSYRSTKMGYDFLPDLEIVPWDGRVVYIAYDSDADNNPNMITARQRLANELIQRGAIVFATRLPQLGPGKTGLDDFLISPAGGANAFQQLLDEAIQLSISWQLFYQLRGNSPALSVANVMVALRNAPELRDIFRFDEMAQLVVLTASLPNDMSNLELPRRQTDNDTVRVQEWLQREGELTTIGPDIVGSGIKSRAIEQSYHPVKDYLLSVTWDKKERLPTWLPDAFGTEDTPYTETIGTMFLISMVARIMEPGVKADCMLVLEGAQGLGKSSACQILADRWFSDSLPDINSSDQKRVSMHLRGKWLIEIAELGAMKKSDVEDVKKFISRQKEDYLPSYNKIEVEEPRQCVFIGTTNEEVYLKDETGNRRFWPVKIIKVDLEWLRVNRDQLFAEAMVRYARGEKGYPDEEFQATFIQPEQDARFVGGEWDDEVEKFLDFKLKDPNVPPAAVRVQAKEVVIHVLSELEKSRVPAHCKSFAAAMRRVGWVPAPRLKGSNPYMPGEAVLARVAREKSAEPPTRTKSSPKVVPIRSTVKKY